MSSAGGARSGTVPLRRPPSAGPTRAFAAERAPSQGERKAPTDGGALRAELQRLQRYRLQPSGGSGGSSSIGAGGSHGARHERPLTAGAKRPSKQQQQQQQQQQHADSNLARYHQVRQYKRAEQGSARQRAAYERYDRPGTSNSRGGGSSVSSGMVRTRPGLTAARSGGSGGGGGGQQQHSSSRPFSAAKERLVQRAVAGAAATQQQTTSTAGGPGEIGIDQQPPLSKSMLSRQAGASGSGRRPSSGPAAPNRPGGAAAASKISSASNAASASASNAGAVAGRPQAPTALHSWPSNSSGSEHPAAHSTSSERSPTMSTRTEPSGEVAGQATEGVGGGGGTTATAAAAGAGAAALVAQQQKQQQHDHRGKNGAKRADSAPLVRAVQRKPSSTTTARSSAGSAGSAGRPMASSSSSTNQQESQRRSSNAFVSQDEMLQLQRAMASGRLPRGRSTTEFYTFGKTIGVGSFGKVRLALHNLTGQKVAVKTYEKSKTKDSSQWKRVQQEVRLMERLNCQHCIRMFEVMETPKRVHIVMDVAEGGSLCSYIKQRKRLHEDEARHVFCQLSKAVEYMHSLNIIHRDIKLENVLVDRNRNMKLIDYGFSVYVRDKKLHIFCGTPSYMAPEIVQRREYWGKPVDVWSLGVLLYACLCGCFPFTARNYPDLYKKIIRGQYRIPDTLSRGARDLIRSMLCTDASRVRSMCFCHVLVCTPLLCTLADGPTCFPFARSAPSACSFTHSRACTAAHDWPGPRTPVGAPIPTPARGPA
jgi:serine/threonine protein kinase